MVRDSLQTEEEAIEASYQRRRQIVLDNLPAGDEQTRLLEKLQREKDLEVAFHEQAQQERHDRLMQASMTEEEIARASRDRLIEEQRLAYQQGVIDHEEFLRNKQALNDQYDQSVQAAMRNRQIATVDMYANLFGSLSQLAGQFAQGQGKSAERGPGEACEEVRMAMHPAKLKERRRAGNGVFGDSPHFQRAVYSWFAAMR